MSGSSWYSTSPIATCHRSHVCGLLWQFVVGSAQRYRAWHVVCFTCHVVLRMSSCADRGQRRFWPAQDKTDSFFVRWLHLWEVLQSWSELANAIVHQILSLVIVAWGGHYFPTLMSWGVRSLLYLPPCKPPGTWQETRRNRSPTSRVRPPESPTSDSVTPHPTAPLGARGDCHPARPVAHFGFSGLLSVGLGFI